MLKFAFMLKTYINDLKAVERLIKSFHKHNMDGLALFIVIEKKDESKLIELVTQIGEEHIYIKSTEEVCKYVVDTPVNGISAGYINQELVKLSFWENQFCENYLCLDSDAYFIRDFYFEDFMHDANTPYTFLVEDNDLKADPLYYDSFWRERERSIRNIQKEMGDTNAKYLTCHGFQTISLQVMKSLKYDFMNKKGYSYLDLLKISPLEFSWYNLWIQKKNIIPIYVREPVFKYFHMKHQLVFAWFQGITLQDWARSYVGIVLQSNWSNKKGLFQYEDASSLYIELSHGRVRRIFLYGVWTVVSRVKRKVSNILCKMRSI